jgi:plastocyanin
MSMPRLAPFLVLLALAGCGGGGGGAGSPSGPSNPAPSLEPPVATTTITINGSGLVTPNNITISPGQRVTIVNQHSRAHDVSSDPHPDHTNCPQINAVGLLNPGQTGQTSPFTTAATCGFHDHNDPNNVNLRGRITIQ